MFNHETIEDRARQAHKIIQSPANYKICCGCDSIVLQRAVTCPNCASYRFEENQTLIVEQARILGGRPRTAVLATDLR